MRITDLIGLIFYNINRRKGRVALTAIGVVIGTAAVVILVSLANGLQRSATNNLAGITDLTAIQVMPRYEDMYMGPGGGSSGPGQVPDMKLLTEPNLAEIAALPHVAAVIPKDSLKAMGILRYGRLENYPMITGAGVADVSELGFKVKEGVGALEKAQ